MKTSATTPEDASSAASVSTRAAPTLAQELAANLAEQREAAAAPPTAGVMLWREDLVKEEVLIRLALSASRPAPPSSS